MVCRLHGMDLRVTVSTTFKCMLGNKSKVLQMEVTPDVFDATFKKSGDKIMYQIPPCLGIFEADAAPTVTEKSQMRMAS